MPLQNRSNDSASEDEDDVDLQRNNQNGSGNYEDDAVEQEVQESDDDDGSSSSSDEDDVTAQMFSCICWALLFPDIDGYMAKESAFSTDEKARNKQIQASIAQTSRRQLQALGKRKTNAKATENAYVRRSQSTTRNLRGRKRQKSTEPHDSENEVDADNGNRGKDSSSTDETKPATEVKLIRYKRSSGANGGCDDNKPEGVCDIGLELVGCVSIYKHGGQPKKKSSRTLSRSAHVCFGWFPYHRYN